MTPLILGLGVPELLIILAVVLLLFGGSRLAGLGKSSGRALREFKEETRSLKGDDQQQPPPTATTVDPQQPQVYQQPPTSNVQQPTNIQQPGDGEPRRDA